MQNYVLLVTLALFIILLGFILFGLWLRRSLVQLLSERIIQERKMVERQMQSQINDLQQRSLLVQQDNELRVTEYRQRFTEYLVRLTDVLRSHDRGSSWSSLQDQLNETREALRSSLTQVAQVRDVVNLVFMIQQISEKQRELERETAQIRQIYDHQRLIQNGIAESVARLERVLAGPKVRGDLGEMLVEQQLTTLPPNWIARNVRFTDGKVVEFALRAPNGRLIPIDSKWTATELLDRLGQT